MGNRCVVAQCVKEKNAIRIKKFYMHWNGGWDSVNPLLSIAKHNQTTFEKLFEISKTAFGSVGNYHIETIENEQDFKNFLKAYYLLDNGIYFIDNNYNLKCRINYFFGFEEQDGYDFDEIVAYIQKSNNLEEIKIKNHYEKVLFSNNDVDDIKKQFQAKWVKHFNTLDDCEKAFVNELENKLKNNFYNNNFKVADSQKFQLLTEDEVDRCVENFSGREPINLDYNFYHTKLYLCLNAPNFDEFKKLF